MSRIDMAYDDDEDDDIWLTLDGGSDSIATAEPPSPAPFPGAAAHLPPGLYGLAPGSDRHLLRLPPRPCEPNFNSTGQSGKTTEGESSLSSPPVPKTPESDRSDNRQAAHGRTKSGTTPNEHPRADVQRSTSDEHPFLDLPANLARIRPELAVGRGTSGQSVHGDNGKILANVVHYDAKASKIEGAAGTADGSTPMGEVVGNDSMDWWYTEWALEGVLSQLRDHWAVMGRTWYEEVYRSEIAACMYTVRSIEYHQVRIKELNRLLFEWSECRLADPLSVDRLLERLPIASLVPGSVEQRDMMRIRGSSDKTQSLGIHGSDRGYFPRLSENEGASTSIEAGPRHAEGKDQQVTRHTSTGGLTIVNSAAGHGERVLQIDTESFDNRQERSDGIIANHWVQHVPAANESPNGAATDLSARPPPLQQSLLCDVPEQANEIDAKVEATVHDVESLLAGSEEIESGDDQPDPDAGVIGGERESALLQRRLAGTAQLWSNDARTCTATIANVWEPLKHCHGPSSAWRPWNDGTHTLADSLRPDVGDVDTVGFLRLDAPSPAPPALQHPQLVETALPAAGAEAQQAAPTSDEAVDQHPEADLSRSNNDDHKSNYSAEYPSLATASSSKRDKGKGRARPEGETGQIASTSRSTALNADARSFQPVQRTVDPAEQMQWLRAKMEEMRVLGEQQASTVMAHAMDRQAAFPHFLVPVVGTSAYGQKYYDDWICECKYHNFGRNIRCNRCGIAGPRTETKHHDLQLGIPGDWDCRCGSTNWRRRRTCHKCGVHEYWGARFYY